MMIKKIQFNLKKVSVSFVMLFSSVSLFSQTNVFDDVIDVSPNHTSLSAAISTAGLEGALQNPSATLTVFAPDNQAFDNLAAALGTDINGLLALPNLSDILLYHVLGSTVDAASVMNGAIVDPLNNANSIKLTKTSGNAVYANQAMVNGADLMTDNGVVHSVDAVLLASETVVDVAIDNGFSSLTTAVITAELLPALTDPFADYTVFAPSNMAFDNLAAALGTDIAGLLALPNLSDILLYHVLGASAPASGINNGDIVTPLNSINSIKLTKTSMGDVYANQAMVTLADVSADNCVVHVLDGVILPYETVVDIAIDNGFTSLSAAVVEAELLPALSNPLGTFTVFAPTNAAFDDLASDLGTDLNGVLASPDLADILLYHVLGSIVTSGDIMNGSVTTLEGSDVLVDLASGVMVNNASVTLADVSSQNGVVHVIDKVLIPGTASIDESEIISFEMYPNPASSFVVIESNQSVILNAEVINNDGQTVKTFKINANETELNISDLPVGKYVVSIQTIDGVAIKKLVIASGK